MQISKQKVNQALNQQLSAMLYQLIVDIKTPEEAEKIFTNLLSDTEITTVIKRLGVAYWLTKKRSYEIIKGNLKVSSATIATLGREIKSAGWQMAIKKVLAEEWATKWETKINNLLNKSK
jgi:uncharacterized protein YerC